MKFFRVFAFLLPLLLAGCGLSEQQKADYTAVQSSGVNAAVYDKMIHGDPLSLYDIKALARSHVSDGVTLRYLRDHGTVYSLNSADVESLRKAGVSESIVDYMLQTPQQYNGPYPYPYGPVGLGYGPYWGGPFWGDPFWGPYYGYGYGYHRHWH